MTTTMFPPGLKDFGDAYVEAYDELALRLREALARHATFGPLIAATPPDMVRAASVEARTVALGALAGDWAPYEAKLRRDGANYARLGVSFADWYELVNGWSDHMFAILIRRLVGEPERLADALVAMKHFLGRGMVALGESYLLGYSAELRRKEEEALAKTRELAKWEGIFERVAWGIAITDPSGRAVAAANPAFARMYGIPAEELRGFPIERIYAPGRFDEATRDQRERARAKGYVSFESVHQRRDGATFPVQVEAARVSTEGEGEVWALTARDLTERDQLLTLRAHSVELEVENRRIHEASRMKSEFLANMSHELRTPLNSILGFSGLLVDGSVGPLSVQQREFIGDIHASGKHLLRLISDVLDLSKVEAGRMEFRPETLDVGAIVREVVGILRGIAHDKEIEPQIEVDPRIGPVHVDASRLKQVLYNFLSNAYKFSPPKGAVIVRATNEGAAFRVAVRDRGPGIAERDLPRLFQQFEQLDAGASKAHAGTGLGLALTRGLVEAQGGTVGVTSVEGVGSEFHAVLPKHAHTRVALPQPRRIAGPTASSPRILVIEDDPADQDRIVSALVDAGYAVDTASTGAQGIRAYEERDYAAITLDLILPDTSGLDVLHRLRSTPPQGARARAEVPVVVISVAASGAMGGLVVHDALQKPVDGDALLGSLARAGVVVGDASGPILVVDDDEASARLMVASLERAGFASRVAIDGEQALALAESETPAAVVLDLVMPKLDGAGFLERFRATPRWDHVPVLVWSVEDVGAARAAEHLRGAEAVLLKDGSSAGSIVDLLRRHLPRGGRP